MNMKKLTTLLLTATLGLASGAALAADAGAQSNNGQANSSADAGQVAPDAVKTWRRITSIIAKSILALALALAAPCFILTARR